MDNVLHPKIKTAYKPEYDAIIVGLHFLKSYLDGNIVSDESFDAFLGEYAKMSPGPAPIDAQGVEDLIEELQGM